MALSLDKEGELLRALLTSRGISKPLVLSYNHFLAYRLPKIINRTTLQIPSVGEASERYVEFTDVKYHDPVVLNENDDYVKLYPMEARRKTLSYMSDISTSIIIRDEDGNISEKKEEVFTSKIPIMYGCDLDITANMTPDEKYEVGEGRQDTDGYFIIKGMEKVLLHIDKLRFGLPLLYLDKRLNEESNIPKKLYAVRYTGKTYDSTSVIQVFERFGIQCAFSGVDSDLNIFSIYEILYERREKQDINIWLEEVITMIENFIIDDDKNVEYRRRSKMRTILTNTITIYKGTNENIYNFIESHIKKEILKNVKDRKTFIKQYVNRILLHNIKTNKSKLGIFSYMVAKLIDFKNGFRNLDDRDNWSFKKVDDPAMHMENAFNSIWNTVIENLSNNMKTNRIDNASDIARMLNPNEIGNTFVKYFSTEVWSERKNRDKSKNVVIVDTLKRDTILASYSHVRQINTPTSKSGPVKEKRMVFNSQWGVVCAVKTPEGKNCGLVRASAVTTWVSVERDESEIIDIIAPIINGKTIPKYREIPYVNEEKKIKSVNSLFVNGRWIGFTNAFKIRQLILNARRNGEISFDIGVVIDLNDDLWINSDAGRLCRPLLIVENNRLVIDSKGLRNTNVDFLLNNGAMEYVDVAEQNSKHITIAIKSRQLNNDLDDTIYTHCEIDPTAILGISANIIPFPEFMQGPRNAYQSGMGEQAITSNPIRNELRFDTTMNTIVEPGVPLVATDAHSIIGLDDYPQGNNVIIAITPYGGYNQEDAIILNKASVQRGLFKLTTYHKFEVVIERSNNYLEIIEIPSYEEVDSDKYSKLETDKKSDMYGIVRTGEYVKTGDILVGKIAQETDSNGKVIRRDVSKKVEEHKEGQVMEVIRTKNIEGYHVIRIRVAEVRDLEEGDKLASRYSQKGIIAKMLNQEDMPFTPGMDKSTEFGRLFGGVTPDILFNPHGIPSRMTIGKLMEIMVGPYALVTGKRINATAFREFNYKVFTEELSRLGFTRDQTVPMINGMTGEMFDSSIFMGPVYYQVLRHFVNDKINARSTGLIENITRQPIGRARLEGGGRFGVMEKDALIAHGSSNFLQDRMMISSDDFKTIVCRSCGNLAIANKETSQVICRGCQHNDFSKIRTPYVFKTFMQLLSGAGIKVGIKA